MTELGADQNCGHRQHEGDASWRQEDVAQRDQHDAGHDHGLHEQAQRAEELADEPVAVR